VSQVLTLYTTPVVYLGLEQLRRRLSPGSRAHRPGSDHGALEAQP
jgi:hypothetical protein